MLRLIRILGILIFALLIGFSASRLRAQYKAGTLFEQYNSQRKADVTLLVFTAFGLATLGWFEVTHSRRKVRRYGYTSSKLDDSPVVDGLDSTSIYSLPDTLDKWGGRRERDSKSHHRKSRGLARFWMSSLRIYSVVIAVVYAFLFAGSLFGWMPIDIAAPVLAGVFGSMFLFSLVTATGLILTRSWGTGCGYAMAIIQLLVFPIGTAAGLVLLVFLVGASPLFSAPARERQRAARRKSRQKQFRSAPG